MLARFTVAVVFTALLSAITFAADPIVEPTGTWSGKVEEEALRTLAPASGLIGDTATWNRLWASWRADEEPTEVDFAKELVLVGTVSGPNLVMMRPTIDDTGNVKYVVGGTKMAGPGFGYKLISISRKDVKTVNGKAVTDEIARLEDSITVAIVGTLRTGISAIGGETTGTTITAKGITWELQLGERLSYQQAAERLHGKRVIVRGTLERRRGVEIKERWIVTVTELQAVDAVGLGGSSQSRLIATVGRADTRIRFVSEPKTTIVDVDSRFGIDTATIKRESNSWPVAIVVRVHLKGLESFSAMVGDTAVEWSVSSTGSHRKRVSLRKGGDESAIDPESPYYSDIRITGGNDKIPLQDGYFEVALPAKLLEGNPEEITLRWIDFYRN